MQRKATGFLFLLSILIFSGAIQDRLFSASVPLTYNAVTDHLPRAKPALPRLGAANTVIADPTFGSRILRVTDGNTMPGRINGSFQTPSGGFTNNWNSDSTMFWVHSPDGAIVYKLDKSTLRATRVGDTNSSSGGLLLNQMAVGPFSYRRPNIVYGVSGRTIKQYDILSRTYTTIFDANSVVPGATQYAYSVAVSDDDMKFSFAFGGMQDTYPYVVFWDKSTGKSQILNTRGSTLNGRATNISLGFGIHSTSMDRTGRYVIIVKGQGKVAGTSDYVVWDTQTGVLVEIRPQASGHEVNGFGYRVNQCGYSGPGWYEGVQYCIRPLATGSISQVKYLIDPAELPLPHLVHGNGHLSWNNARPDAMVPVLASVIREAKDAWAPPRPWDDEIIGLRTDGVRQTVWRFAHHRTKYDGNFWDSPRGNVSQDGRYYVFTSNWEKTLGTQPNGGTRQDVFIVELVGSQMSPTTPPPTTTTPTTPPPTTVTGPVRINSGGASFTDSQGKTWISDTNYAGGTTYKCSNTISGTTMQGLYQDERYGNFTYQFAVANGNHTVNLRFAEIYHMSPGKRLFNVTINGNRVLSNFDIVAAAGGTHKTIDRQFPVSVTNGQLAIQFTSVVDNAKVNAIEIDAPVTSTPTTPPPTTTTPSTTRAINAGGSAYTDAQGMVWSADSGFTGGSTWTTATPIKGTAAQKVYQTERYGNFSYLLAASNGFHTVRLRFSENYLNSPRQRLFNVKINGSQVLTNFDILSAAGGPFTAVDRQFGVQVTTGQIKIEFISVADNAKVNAIQIDPPASLVAANAGGPAFTDPTAQDWTADAGFSGGQTYTTSASISGTNTPAIYKTERYGALTYKFSVPNGTRTVRLKFAEIYHNTSGKRVFNVIINGSQVLTNFDVAAAAGGAFTAVDRQFAVPVTAGQVSIQLVRVIDDPKISAIEIQ